VRSVVLSDNIPFVISLGKTPVVLVHRHPDYKGSATIEKFKAEYQANCTRMGRARNRM
jgi:hypothetical protein